jgi:hypothetical protein
MGDPDLTIRVIIFVAVFVALLEAHDFYNRRCQERFGVQPLKMSAITWWVVLIAVIYLGHGWRLRIAEIGRDKPEGLILMGLGAVGVIASLVSNVRRTNMVYGIAGTALKFASALLFVLFANYTVIGWFGFLGLLASCADDGSYPGPLIRHDPRLDDPEW